MPRKIQRRERKNGQASWMVQLRVGTKPDGRPHWLTKTFRKKTDAVQYLREREGEISKGGAVVPSKASLDEHLNRWLEVVESSLRPNTYESYRWTLAKYVRPELGMRRIDTLTSQVIERVYARMLKKGLSSRMVRLTHAILRRSLQHAVRHRVLIANPCDAVQLPRKVRREMQAMTREQATAFLKAAAGNRYEALFVLAVSTGLRPSEYLALRWEDVDLEAGTVTVRRTIHRKKGGGFEFHETKTDKSRRTLPVSESVVASLKEHHRRQSAERLKAGPLWTDLGLVFTNEIGGPVDEGNLRHRHFLDVLTKAGLVEVIEPPTPVERKGKHGPKPKPKAKVRPLFRLYDLRHTAATLLLIARENPKVVSERLGHASVMITLDTYSHVLPDMQQQASETLEKLLFSGNGS